jgi:hypothetical protein
MEVVGLSPALGFLAGVVLAESEFRRELETDIEPFRGLLRPVLHHRRRGPRPRPGRGPPAADRQPGRSA